jgi:hypothetical protein
LTARTWEWHEPHQATAVSPGDIRLPAAAPRGDARRGPTGHRLTGLGRPVTASDLVQERLIMHFATHARYFYDFVVVLVPIRTRTS